MKLLKECFKDKKGRIRVRAALFIFIGSFHVYDIPDPIYLRLVNCFILGEPS